MAKSAKGAPEEAEAPAKPKSKRLLLVAVGILVLAAIGGAGWHFLSGKKQDEPKPVAVEKPVFMNLEPFTVNLQNEGGGEQYLQVGITLKLPSIKQEEQITERLPEVRSHLLFLLSSKHPMDLVPIEGKKKLAREIAMSINSTLGLGNVSKNAATHEGGPASEVSAAEPQEAASPASAPAEATSMAHGGMANDGGIEVLFTTFIIQ